ncbi:hypothetical protein KOW79_003577 [Hemibagrus wyckioides]|uniref:Uncharacterized protein n=1 Tax=Hemibagrus wyckioides TaxID=337641 RepID=A0A9D3SR33_9TELE|nr:hypothetical protein KOW79_003577 [Hemibagrus wyckioides]
MESLHASHLRLESSSRLTSKEPRATACSAAPQTTMSYYMDPVSSYQLHHPADHLGVMRQTGGMAVSMVTPSQLPGVCHPQHAPPARAAYAHNITLQEVPNGPEFCPNDSLFLCDELSRRGGGLFQNYPCLPPHMPLKSSPPASGSSAVSDVGRNAEDGGFFKMENVVSG